MTDLLNGNLHALSPDLFAAFMVADTVMSEEILNMIVPIKNIKIGSVATGYVNDEVAPDLPYVQFSVTLGGGARSEIFMSCLNHENALKGPAILDWLNDFAKINSNNAIPMVVLLDESDNVRYSDLTKPIEMMTVKKKTGQIDHMYMFANLHSDKYPLHLKALIDDLLQTDAEKFQIPGMKDVYDKACVMAGIEEKKKTARDRWISELKTEIEKLGVNPDDFLKTLKE